MWDELFKKLGVKGYDELSVEERKTFRDWQQALYPQPITLEDLKKFLMIQVEQARVEILNYENGDRKELYLKAKLRNLEMIAAFLESPDKRKEQAVAQIKQRFNIDI